MLELCVVSLRWNAAFHILKHKYLHDDDDDDDNIINNSLSEPTENRIILGLRNVTATRHLSADRPPTESQQNRSLPKNAK